MRHCEYITAHGNSAVLVIDKAVLRLLHSTMDTRAPQFLTPADILEIHADQLARYGGSGGLRDRGLLCQHHPFVERRGIPAVA